MININFRLGGDLITVKIEGTSVFFYDPSLSLYTTIEGLKLNKAGVIKEFPDLKDNENWKGEAVKRFKEHIKKLNNEQNRKNYVIEELKKHGYTPISIQRKGYRPEKI